MPCPEILQLDALRNAVVNDTLHQCRGFYMITGLGIHFHKRKICRGKSFFVSILLSKLTVTCKEEHGGIETVRTEFIGHPGIERNLIFVTSVRTIDLPDGLYPGLKRLFIGRLHRQCRIQLVYSFVYNASFASAEAQTHKQSYVNTFPDHITNLPVTIR